MSPKAKPVQQQRLTTFPLIKKPMELIGKQVKVPGSYWAGRQTAEEKAERVRDDVEA